MIHLPLLLAGTATATNNNNNHTGFQLRRLNAGNGTTTSKSLCTRHTSHITHKSTRPKNPKFSINKYPWIKVSLAIPLSRIRVKYPDKNSCVSPCALLVARCCCCFSAFFVARYCFLRSASLSFSPFRLFLLTTLDTINFSTKLLSQFVAYGYFSRNSLQYSEVSSLTSQFTPDIVAKYRGPHCSTTHEALRWTRANHR